MTKKNIMRYAHQLAKKLVEKTENYQIALSMALKEIWRQVKTYNKKRFTKYSIATAYDRIGNSNYHKMISSNISNDVYGVPSWIIEKNLNNNEAYAVLNECDAMTVVRETEKAQLVEFVTNHGKISMWTPKSVLAA